MTPQPTLVLDRVLRVLRPLVRLMVASGVTYPVFAAALKRVFLDAARQELAARAMAPTDSAVTLLSGVHRRDVRQLTRGAAVSADAAPATVPDAPLGLAAQVVGRWMSDAAFVDADGQPRVLARQAPGAGDAAAPGFDALVDGVSRDVRPRAVLDELLRLGVATLADDGAVALSGGGFAPRRGFDELSRLFADNLHDHAAAAAANLQGRDDFLEQAVFVDGLGDASVQALREAARRAWRQALATVMPVARQRFEADRAAAADGDGSADTDAPAALPPRQRARFGVYFFSEPEDPAR